MTIYFIRHGYPDYSTDSLTALGKKQAEAVAERLENCGIEKIYSSTQGRAMETAGYTAARLGLDVIPCKFMRELQWGARDDEEIAGEGQSCQPWTVAGTYTTEGKSLRSDDWQTSDPYSKSKIVNSVKMVMEGLDAWLQDLGYQREGEYYRVVGENTNKTVAIFSHAGSSSAAIAHLLNIPFPQICGMFDIDFTTVTTVKLPNRVGQLICPKLHHLDSSHIADLHE